VTGQTGGNFQYAQGDYIAQAAPGGTAIVVSYQFAPPAPVDEQVLAEAAARLAELPEDASRGTNPGVLPATSRLPFAGNPLFVGRDDALADLARACKRPAAPGRVPTVAVTGIGGIGKTQLAIEFAHRYGSYFAGGVYWVSFADPAAIPAEFAACGGAGAMDLRPDYAALALADQVQLVMSAWRGDLPRLLIFDNCESEADLAQWRPPGGGSRVLVTARRDRWSPALNVTAVPLDTLDLAGGVSLLRQYRPDLDASDAGLGRIAVALDGLPLALHLAGSFLFRYRSAITTERYAADLVRPDLIKHRSLEGSGISPTGHVESVARTFALSYERLDATVPADALALALLARASRFAPGEQIPKTLLLAALSGQAGDSRGGPAAEPTDLDALLAVEDAIARAVELGLLEEPGPDALRMHRLIAAFVLGASDDGAAQSDVESAVLAEYDSRLREEGLLRAGELLPHLRAAADASIGRRDLGAWRLCDVLGGHLREIGAFPEACRYLSVALEIAGEVLGAGNPGLARPLNDLGLALLRAGRSDEALDLFERAVPMWQQQEDEENMAATLDNMGQLLLDRDLPAASRHFEAALEIRLRLLGPEHPRTGVTLNNLGTVAYKLGNIGAAVEYYEAALVAKGQQPTPSLAATHMELASSRFAQGDLAAAHAHYAQAAAIFARTLGLANPRSVSASIGTELTSPDVLSGTGSELTARTARIADDALSGSRTGYTVLNNIGLMLWQRGEDDAAAILYRTAVRLIEEAKPRDPLAATEFNNLAMLHQRRHEYHEALECFDRAHTLLTDRNGDSVLLARVRNNMGLLLLQMGDLARSREMLTQALDARLALLGADSPDTAITRANLAVLAAREGDTRAARRQLEQALVTVERGLGGNSPQAARIRRELGLVLRASGKLREAGEQLQMALAIQRRSLAARHPDLIDTLNALGALAQDRDKRDEAARYFAEARDIAAFRYPREAAEATAATLRSEN
jgi:tetratricopeptide (TPR) repeat protein